MNIDEVPDLKSSRYPARITIAIDFATKEKLNDLKRVKRKDPSALVRMLIEEFLKSVELQGS